MQHHYATVAAAEKQHAIAKVIELAGVRGALARGGVHARWYAAPSGQQNRR